MADPTMMSPASGGGDPTQATQGAPATPGDSGGVETITITCNPDGSYSVDDGDGEQPVPCKSIGDVMKAVHEALSGDSDPKSQWDQEAQTRDASGMRGSAPAGGPQMTM